MLWKTSDINILECYNTNLASELIEPVDTEVEHCHFAYHGSLSSFVVILVKL